MEKIDQDKVQPVDTTTKDTSVGDLLDVSAEESNRVRWKIDLILLPLLGFCYMLQFLDKQTLNFATLLGMLEDTHLHGSQYSWTASVFYFGYMFWSYPTAYLSVRLRIGKYLAATVIIWAAVLMCHAACHNFAGLMITRFLLGAFEAAIAPGFSLVTGMWYTRQEQPWRYGLWFCGGALASLIGGVSAYGVGHIEGALRPWKYLFLIFGAITAAWGIVMLIFLPDNPASTWWLSANERQIASNRLLKDNQASSASSFKMYQVIETFRDPATWFLFLYTFCVNIANGGLTAFGSLVIQGFGYEGLQALLIQMPSGAAQFGFVIVSSFICSRFNNIRTTMMIALTLTSLLGMVLMYALDPSNQSGRMAGFCLSLAFSANMPIALSLVTGNVRGYTKKSVVNACVLIMYCVGNIVGPQFFNVNDAPNYPKGIKASLVGFCLGALWILCLRFYLVWQNARRAEEPQISEAERMQMILDDKTDWEIPGCQYVL